MPSDSMTYPQVAPKKVTKAETLWQEINNTELVTQRLCKLLNRITEEPVPDKKEKEHKETLADLLYSGAEMLASMRIQQEDLISHIEEILF